MKKFFIFVFLSSIISSINLFSQWVLVNNGMGNSSVYSFVVKNNTIFSGTIYNGVFSSTDNGITWNQTTLSVGKVSSMVVKGNNIIAGTIRLPLNNAFIYLSTNSGLDWTQNLLYRDFRALSLCGNRILAGCGSNWGIYQSIDSGFSWSQISLNAETVNSLAVNGNSIFAGTSFDGVFFSTNSGLNWAQTSLNNQTVHSLTINGNNIFAGTQSNGVYLSTDNGSSWAYSFLLNRTVYSLVSLGNVTFAGTNNSGVWVSSDNGTNWQQRNEGLVNLKVNSLYIYNNYIFAGTDTGVYRRLLSDLTGIKPVTEQIPMHFSLSQNYPNPFNPNTNIKFDLPKIANIKLVVYDILGKEVETLVNESLKPGSYAASFDGSNVSSGIYFYKFQASDYVETRKMILLK